MTEVATYSFYITIFLLVLNFILGKLKLIPLLLGYPAQKKTPAAELSIGISVIICARNDMKNLEQHLPSVLEQDYPDFEVIVVDDASTDGTFSYLQEQANQYSWLKIYRIEDKTTPGKKKALQLGMVNASYPFLLLTDADCSPDSNKWINSHAAFARETNTVVLGYGRYKKQKGFLNLLIRFDTVSIAINYMSRALWKSAYMGVGRNMGYSADLAEVPMDKHSSLASGDDDLFVQAANKKSIFFVNLEKESFTTSLAKPNWKLWMDQKGRHTTTAPYYRLSTKVWLMLQWMVSAGFYIGIFTILLTGHPLIALMLFLLNALSTMLFNGLWLRKLGEKDLILLTPLLDFIYTFVQPIFVIKSWGRKKDEWN